MPDVDGADHLTDYFFEVGPAPGGEELSHTELRNWQENTGVQLDAFGAQMLKAMSRTYLAMLHDARKPGAPWPAKRDLTRDEEIAKARRLRKRAKDTKG